MSTGQASEVRIPASRKARELVREKKRGGETYDEVLRKMAEQYDPDYAHE